MLSGTEIRRVLPSPPVSLLVASYGNSFIPCELAQRLREVITGLSPAELEAHQDRALSEYTGVTFTRHGHTTSQTATSSRMPVIKCKSYSLFGDSSCHSVRCSLTDEVHVSNKSKRSVSFTVRALSDTLPTQDNCIPPSGISFSIPSSACLKRAAKEKFLVGVTALKGGTLSDVVVLTLDTHIHLFLVCKISVAPSVFGVSPEFLDSTIEVSPVTLHKCRVPVVLSSLCKTYTSSKMYEFEGTFRKSASGDMMQEARLLLESGLPNPQFDLCIAKDPHIVPGLIKLWLRELPMDAKPLGLFDRNRFAMYEERGWDLLGLTYDSWFYYLMSFMAFVCSYEVQNRMNPQAIATCLTPNLYSMTDPNDTNLDLMLIDRIKKWNTSKLTEILASKL
eukprot:ANDGO_06160.mRNA.1 Rho GTPase-activating protein 5